MRKGLRMQRTLLIIALAIMFSPVCYSQSLFDAARSGSPKEIQAALGTGASVSERNKDGLTPLMIAAASNTNIEAIKALLAAGRRLAIARGRVGRRSCSPPPATEILM